MEKFTPEKKNNKFEMPKITKARAIALSLGLAFSQISEAQANIFGGGGFRNAPVGQVAMAGMASAQNRAIDAMRAADHINSTYNRQIVHNYEVNNALNNSVANTASQRINQQRAAFQNAEQNIHLHDAEKEVVQEQEVQKPQQ